MTNDQIETLTQYLTNHPVIKQHHIGSDGIIWTLQGVNEGRFIVAYTEWNGKQLLNGSTEYHKLPNSTTCPVAFVLLTSTTPGNVEWRKKIMATVPTRRRGAA